MTTLAVIAVALAVGAWAAGRWIEARQRVDDLITVVLSTPLPPDVRVAAIPPAPRTGPAPADSPSAGAGPTPKPPALPALTGKPARPAPGQQ